MNRSATIKGNRFLVLGRIGMDLYPPIGEKIAAATRFDPALGGSSGNIAAGLARLGGRVEVLSRVSNDPIGRFVRNQCAQYGIGTAFLGDAPFGANTSLAMAENRIDDWEVVLYRGGAADLLFDIGQLDQVDFAEFDTMVLTGTALSAEPSASACFEAIRRMQSAGGVVVFDVDWRPAAWLDDRERARAAFVAACDIADIVVGNDDEFEVIAPSTGLDHARALGRDRLVIYKMGEKGAIAIDHGVEDFVDIYPVDALKPVGAGDAFIAGLLSALADGADTRLAVQYGAANAAIVVSRPACAPAMATRAELDEFIKAHE